jgi:hypothetical protein
MRRSNRSRAQRGSALVLAIMILFAMLALGLLAMRTTTQNIAGSGNLRASKQARYVAEVGLYQAITLMQQDGDKLMAMRRGLRFSYLILDSKGIAQAYDADDNTLGPAKPMGDPAMLGAPAALGAALSTALQTSYRVRVDGFFVGPPPPGNSAGGNATPGQIFCMMQFTAAGYVADRELPTREQLLERGGADRFAEAEVKAAVVLGPFGGDCRS